MGSSELCSLGAGRLVPAKGECPIQNGSTDQPRGLFFKLSRFLEQDTAMPVAVAEYLSCALTEIRASSVRQGGTAPAGFPASQRLVSALGK